MNKPTVTDLINDPSTPYWAKALCSKLSDKDPVDVVNTLEVILAAFKQDEQPVLDNLLAQEVNRLRALILLAADADTGEGHGLPQEIYDAADEIRAGQPKPTVSWAYRTFLRALGGLYYSHLSDEMRIVYSYLMENNQNVEPQALQILDRLSKTSY